MNHRLWEFEAGNIFHLDYHYSLPLLVTSTK